MHGQDAELGKQLLQIAGELAAGGRVLHRKALAGIPTAAVAFEGRHQESPLDSGTTLPHELGHHFVARLMTEELSEWRHAEGVHAPAVLLDVELANQLAVDSRLPLRHIPSATDHVIVGVQD